ncbi:hypothetical protein [Fluviicola sp.]|uniref:hypothetical protein n=1 Tax=Fluviicola sp. TaxID=1917219 RepID=UPI0031D5E6DE
MKHYKKFHNRIAEINDSIIYHTFCSKQIENEVEHFKKNYKGSKPLEKIANREIFNSNIYSGKFNKTTREITESINKSNQFIYDNSLILIYLQLEIFVQEYYTSIQSIERFLRGKKIKLRLDEFKLIQSNSLDKLDEKLRTLVEQYLKKGIILNVTRREREREEIQETTSLIDLNTNQVVNSVLYNLGVCNENCEVSSHWGTILNRNNIPFQVLFDTLEYFRLRRNVIAHREPNDRANGTFGDFISKKGEFLNHQWNVIKGLDNRYVDFESNRLMFSNYLEVIESINILRKIADNLDSMFSSVFTEKELLLYFYESFQSDRIIENKGNFNLSTDFDRFYSKFKGYLNSNFVKLTITKEEIKEFLMNLGK